uniref:Uncharacterized protein n=1 Tax=Paulinella longichromatophora TaxID=1708747 RepID=A0A2H4ZPZ3_9EUKA|nr:hypothetical protein PLO_594 [Paulinella longichromatophora]
MGEAKRRGTQKSFVSRDSNKDENLKNILSWLRITQEQASTFVAITTRGAWTGITTLILFWIIIRFIGPIAHLWRLSDMNLNLI